MKEPASTHRLLKVATILWAILPGTAIGQSTSPSPTPVDPLAGAPLQVLDQQQVAVGTHVITLNRIAPPHLQPLQPTPTAAAQTQGTTPAKTTRTVSTKPTTRSAKGKNARSASSNSDTGNDQEKPLKVLSFSATVYDHQFTELRWYGGNRPELRVYVNIDFNLLAGATNIVTPDAVYMPIFGLGNDTVDTLVQTGGQVPDLSQFPVGASAYQIVQGDPDDHPDEVAALVALCLYHDGNKVQLAAAYQERLADQAAHDQWLRDHPPVQPDTVINYWPTKNSIFLSQGQ